MRQGEGLAATALERVCTEALPVPGGTLMREAVSLQPVVLPLGGPQTPLHSAIWAFPPPQYFIYF